MANGNKVTSQDVDWSDGTSWSSTKFLRGDGTWALNSSGSTQTFANDAARAAAVPDFDGQEGVQLDTNAQYVSYGLSAGNWQLPSNTQVQSDTYAVATGTDTYAITLTPALLAYAAGNSFKVLFTNANTGAATINVNALGAKSITKNNNVALVANDIIAGKIYNLTYDGTDFQIESNDSQVKNIQVSADKYAVATGTDTYAITLAPVPAAYVAGNAYNVLFTNGNTGAATLNVNSLGAIAIKKNASEALVSGDIVAGKIYACRYDGTNFQIDNVNRLPDGTVLNVDATPVGNVGGGTDNLQQYTVPGSTLAIDGDFLDIDISGTLRTDGTVTSINLLFGAMGLFATGGAALAIPNTGGASSVFRIQSKIVRLSATTQLAWTTISFIDGTGVSFTGNLQTTGGETLSGTSILKMQATATNNNDVVQTATIVKYN